MSLVDNWNLRPDDSVDKDERRLVVLVPDSLVLDRQAGPFEVPTPKKKSSEDRSPYAISDCLT